MKKRLIVLCLAALMFSGCASVGRKWNQLFSSSPSQAPAVKSNPQEPQQPKTEIDRKVDQLNRQQRAKLRLQNLID